MAELLPSNATPDPAESDYKSEISRALEDAVSAHKAAEERNEQLQAALDLATAENRTQIEKLTEAARVAASAEAAALDK